MVMTDKGGSNKLLQAFFAPAVALMNRLDITGKFMLLGLMSLVAIGVVVYSLFVSLEQDIIFSQRELKGLKLIRPFPKAIQALQEHRGLSAGLLGGDETMRDSYTNMEKMEKEAAKVLNEMLKKQFSGMASSENLQHIMADWKRMSEEEHGWTAAESFAAHTRLIDRIQSFEGVIADEYALILDPELDTYYLVDTIINKLPQAIERLGRLRAHCTGILAKKQATAQQQIEINILVAELDHAIGTLNTNLDKTGRYNPALQSLISAASRDIADSAQQITGLVASDIFTGHFATLPNDFFGMSTVAIDKSYTQLYEAFLPAAETLIKARIARAENTLRFSVGIAFLLCLLAAYFSIGISRAIAANIRSIARSAHAFADGDLLARIELDARDELGEIGNSFNEMAFMSHCLLVESRENEARLQDLSVHLEERVEERTSELNASNEQLQEEINERKQAERALRESEAILRQLTENIREVFWIGAPDWNEVLYISPAYEEIWGRSCESLYAKPLDWLDAVVEADREQVIDTISKISAGELSNVAFPEYRILRPDGSERWIYARAFPICDEEGKVFRIAGIAEDITVRKHAEEEIRSLAFYDALTGLPNRRLFIDRFQAALSVSARHNNYGAVLFIDLDKFKALNDTLGHDYGDLLLIEVAARIKSCVREMDTVARLGGDEFVVLVEEVSDDLDEASRKVGLVAEKIREALARPYCLKEHEYHISPSIGISLYHGNEETVDTLLHNADLAMYQAKESGRNAVRFFDPVMQQRGNVQHW